MLLAASRAFWSWPAMFGRCRTGAKPAACTMTSAICARPICSRDLGLAAWIRTFPATMTAIWRQNLKEIGFPTWRDTATAPCHTPMPATKKLVMQYPLGTGFVMALFPQGFQVIPLYVSATVIVFDFALLAIFYARSRSSILLTGAFGCLAGQAVKARS